MRESLVYIGNFAKSHILQCGKIIYIYIISHKRECACVGGGRNMTKTDSAKFIGILYKRAFTHNIRSYIRRGSKKYPKSN